MATKPGQPKDGRRKRTPPEPLRNLSYTERLFVDEYLRNGCLGTKAYLVATGSKTSEKAASVVASRWLAKSRIASEIDWRIETAGLTRDKLEKLLFKGVDKAWKDGDTSNFLAGVEKLARLKKLWVEQAEVKTLNEQERAGVEGLVTKMFGQRSIDTEKN